jgi:hypothetical protein
VDEDFSEATNLAEKNPEKLKELQDLFTKEAVKNSVLPILCGLVMQLYWLVFFLVSPVSGMCRNGPRLHCLSITATIATR